MGEGTGMSEMIATRDAFGKALQELGAEYDFLVLDADLAKATKTALFKEKYPERHINVGIAEANLMGIAAGIALSGMDVFACSFAMFAAGRAYEQVRNSIAYPALNVKIGGTHGGLLIGEDGGSHQCIEDLSLMRTLPNMTVINPADAVEVRAAVEAALKIKGPVYLRFGKNAVPTLFNRATYQFEVGKGVLMTDGNDATIIATGVMVQYALEARELLAQEGLQARVINIHTIKPIDREIIVAAAQETGVIVTAEDHNIIGGLGSAVAEVLTEFHPVHLLRVGLRDVFGKSGKPDDLLKKFQMTPRDIATKVKEAIKLKRV
jgi:transketolase